MGDATFEEEKNIINNLELNKIDVLKIGHHGSKYSTSEEFIDAIKPTYGIISVGKNYYGHPSKRVIDLLNVNDTKVYQTSMNGSIKFIIGSKLNVYTCLSDR